MHVSVCTACGNMTHSELPYFKNKLNISCFYISCTHSVSVGTVQREWCLQASSQWLISLCLLKVGNGILFHFPRALLLSSRVPNVRQSIAFQVKQPRVFQFLIRAKQYRDDDSKLISPSKPIAVEYQLSEGNERGTFWMTYRNLTLPNMTYNHEPGRRHVTIIKILIAFLQFHSCNSYKV